MGDLGNLEEFISEYGCPLENAIEYVGNIAEALTFLHSRRFVHRNVRAASVSLWTNGNVSKFSRPFKELFYVIES